MKYLLLILQLIIFNPHVNSQFDSRGIWECINMPDVKVSGVAQVESFPFWIKFAGNEVLISNSNNRRIFSMGMQWQYMKGQWEFKNDSLILHITESRTFSTNTGFYSDQFQGGHAAASRYKPFDIKFHMEKDSSHQILLTPINNFLGYAHDNLNSFPYTFHLKENEKLIMAQTDKTFYFNDKL